MTPHNNANPGDYADAILLPGDPLRAKWIAETFFEAPRLVNEVRNCLGYTGRWKGVPVSVQATGMGQPSTAIYVHELMVAYGAKRLIRVGTCGGLSPKVGLRDIVLGQGATTDSTIVRHGFGNYSYAPIADFNLLRDAAERATAARHKVHVGNLLSSDIFYVEGGIEAYQRLIDHGILGVEMEAATLYTLAARHGVAALAICTMSDSLVTHEQLTPDERATSLKDMVQLALDVAVGA